MIPWVHLASAAVPGSRTALRLMRRGTEFSIMIGGNELMNSRLSGSEEALARHACERLAGRAGPRILVGGLGMGFTLRAALAGLPADAAVEVAELVPAVIAWARGPMAEIFGNSLSDHRVAVLATDVARPIEAARSHYDAILLDVDNGPDGLTSEGNDGLYGAAGLERARRALKPGGVLGVWSAHPDPRFAARMRHAAFTVDEVRVRANGERGGARHTIWFGTKEARGSAA